MERSSDAVCDGESEIGEILHCTMDDIEEIDEMIDLGLIPLEIIEAARQEILQLASKQRYEKMYKTFQNWQELKGTNDISEDTLLAYFLELSRKYKPSTMWAYYSMLKSMISLNFNVNLGTYKHSTKFLKNKSVGYKPVESKAFSREEIDRFISEAPDDIWLDVKVNFLFSNEDFHFS